MPAADAKKMFAPDLSVSRVTLDDGGVTITNTGNKNSPATGFDVLVSFKKTDGTSYKTVWHTNKVIAPGHSRRFNKTFSGGSTLQSGLIRVNPYKKFQEWDYDNNVRYFSLMNQTINTYGVNEYTRCWEEYYDDVTWEIKWGWVPYLSYSGSVANGAYSPILTNPNPDRWGDYVNMFELCASYTKSMYNYITLSGVPNSSHLHVCLQVDDGYYLPMLYNASKSLWEKITTQKIISIVVYSDRNGTQGSADLTSCQNLTVKSKYMKKSWNWKT